VKWRRPPPLRAGDRVGVVAPAGAVDPEQLDRGMQALRGLGFDVVEGRAVRERWRYAAGPMESRMRDLHAFWADDSVAAIFCARGGAGAGWIAAGLDGAALAARPKAFVGYSDLTYLHSLLNAHGLVTYHGPMVASDFAHGLVHDASLRAALFDATSFAVGEGALRPLRAGSAEGRLQGGCMSILSAAAGTPFAMRPDPDGTILFLEDVNERPFRLDRALLQLRASGALQGVRGVVFGEMLGCQPEEGADYSLEDILLGALSGLEAPVAIGLSSGHVENPNVTLPLGARARLTCAGGEARLEILEEAA
jgi:muramoyltetrapeptide carboxypeptidase